MFISFFMTAIIILNFNNYYYNRITNNVAVALSTRQLRLRKNADDDYSTLSLSTLNETLKEHLYDIIHNGINSDFQVDVIKYGLDPLESGDTSKAVSKLNL
eukprot:Pgem_evm1s17390